MPFQKTVNKELALGVPGNFYDVSPRRVSTFVSKANDTVLPAFGLACTVDGAAAKVGGTGKFLGIFVDTHSVPLYGGLTPSVSVPAGTMLPVASFGRVLVKVGAAVTHDSSLPVYNTTTGEISGVAAGSSSAGAGYAFIPGAKFVFVDAAANGTAILQLNDYADEPAAGAGA